MRVQTLQTPDKRHLRAATWDLPPGTTPRAICVLLNGHTEFLEKYGEVAEELVARGLCVVSLDWRGQGASERKVYGNRAGHVGNFEEYDSDLAALLLQMVEPMQRALLQRVPLIALAHSMGAHILLRFLHDHPRRFACAVVLAPMLEIDPGERSPRQIKAVTFALNLRRPSMRFLPGYEEHDPLELPFEGNPLTSDRERFERTRALMKKQPFLRINGPTFGWLGAALTSMAKLRRPSYIQQITTPLLVIGAGEDRVVRIQAIREFVNHLPDGRYVEIENARHEILMENDEIRARFWREFDAFVNENLTKPASR
jgi:lysophospholipase